MKLIYKEGPDNQYNIDPGGTTERQVLVFYANCEYPSRSFYVVELRKYLPTTDSVVERYDDYSTYSVTIPATEYKVVDAFSANDSAIIRAAIKWFDTGEWLVVGGY